MTDIFLAIAAAAVGVLSIGRIIRLLVQDTFPPIVWLRVKWDDKTDGSGWNKLMHCHWCISFWVTVPIVFWGWLSGPDTIWWLFNGCFAASYAAAMVVERDEVVVSEGE